MNIEIQKAFVDGIEEIYSIFFTDGVNDGVNLYLLSDDTIDSFYRESKVKTYKPPVLLIAKAQMEMTPSDNGIESPIHSRPVFTVPLKSLTKNGVSCSNDSDFEVLRKGYIEFHGDFYEIHNVKPNTYLEDVYLTIAFECEINKSVKSLKVKE